MGFENGLRSVGLRGAAGTLILRLLFVADGSGFVTVGTILAAHGFFHRHHHVVKFDFGHAGCIGGGFDGGQEFDFLLLLGPHGFVTRFKRFGGSLTANRDIGFDEVHAVEGINIGLNGFGRNAAGKVNGVHDRYALNRGG